jgi:DtxR family transcriptional regulator, Mn-dependent transcriptional regulator
MNTKTNLSASLEDYVEAIYHIVNDNGVARSKEIATRLNVSRASVTEALRALSKKKLIIYTPYAAITMTEEGKQIARNVVFKHDVLKRFFTNILDIDEDTAEQSACKIEHSAPPELIDKLINFMDFFNTCPRGGEDFLQGFANFHQRGEIQSDCNDCISTCQSKVSSEL